MIPATAGESNRTGLAKAVEVAEFLRTTTGQLARLRFEGRGPRYIRLNGRTIRYSWDDVLRYVRNNVQETADDPGESRPP